MINCGALSSISPQSSFKQTTLSQICSKSQFASLLFPHNNLPTLSSRSSSLRPIYCSSSSPGGNDNKTILDAFFLGKALGEALTERIESAVGEVLSTIGRLQAEQQKQVLEFQEDVLERAKRAKEKAAREALEEQGRLISNSITRTAAKRNGTISSSPGGLLNPDEPGSVGDENRTNSALDSVSSVEIDE